MSKRDCVGDDREKDFMINHNKNELHLQGIGQPMQSPTLFLLS
jgi:hypothetical protein